MNRYFNVIRELFLSIVFVFMVLMLSISPGWSAGMTAMMVKDINPGIGDAFPGDLINVNGTLFFSTVNATGQRSLWKSDGTAAGTVMVKAISPLFILPFSKTTANVNGTLFFAGDGGGGHGAELWKSGGTAANTVLVKDIRSGAGSGPSFLTNVNGTLFFSADDLFPHGRELWKSDGSAAGTVLVKNIEAGAGGSSPSFLTNVNGTLFFSAFDTASGDELWKSDGTTAGTVLVKDIAAAGLSSQPDNLINVNGTLFFRANDGVHGAELWKSDGTSAGTVMVKDINAGAGSSLSLNGAFLTNVNGTLFFRADDGIHGEELWKSDGTAFGTVMVKDITPGASVFSVGPAWLTNVNGTLFFRDDGPSGGSLFPGTELWKSDGTAAGTVMVKDIRIGGSSNPASLTNVNGALFFSADDGVNGAELWRSDGTAAGTVLVKDIYPGFGRFGAFTSRPNYLTNVNGILFFSATDGVNGNELWIVTPPLLLSLSLGDVNGNGSGDVAVLGKRTNTGNYVVRVKDPNTVPHLIREIRLNSSYKPFDMVNLGDVNGDGSADIAVLEVDPVTGLNRQIQVKDGLSGVLIRNIPVRATLKPHMLVSVGNIGGAPALALSEVDAVSGKNVQIQVKNARTGALIRNIPVRATLKPHMLVFVGNIGGVPALALSEVDAVTGKSVQIQVKNARTGALIRNIRVNSTTKPHALIVLADINGNGSSELALSEVNAITGKNVQVQVKDAQTGAKIRNIPMNPNYTPLGMDTGPDSNGNGVAEIGLLEVNGAGHVQVQIKDPLTGAKVSNLAYPKF